MPETRRVPPLRPLTLGELRVIKLLAQGHTYDAIASLCGIGRHGVVWRTRNAARKLPGTLEMRARCITWWRGGTRTALGAGK